MIRGVIEAGQQSGELDKMLNAEWLSYYFNNAFTGLRVLAKTTDETEKLNQIIETKLSILSKAIFFVNSRTIVLVKKF
ncbi:hypothetical protein ACFPYJ_17845 [Paenibacillus solisilvae]|uniref:Uncharacterized protein n=1 Tax=Paenibacillus solisilvae TaxID=2486751 RepID=A0ABW0VYD4_9BACL